MYSFCKPFGKPKTYPSTCLKTLIAKITNLHSLIYKKNKLFSVCFKHLASWTQAYVPIVPCIWFFVMFLVQPKLSLPASGGVIQRSIALDSTEEGSFNRSSLQVMREGGRACPSDLAVVVLRCWRMSRLYANNPYFARRLDWKLFSRIFFAPSIAIAIVSKMWRTSLDESPRCRIGTLLKCCVEIPFSSQTTISSYYNFSAKMR